jgi:hypothetical protein
MRDTYGKMLFLLQDCAQDSVQEAMGMVLHTEVHTVANLIDERGDGAWELLGDPLLLDALDCGTGEYTKREANAMLVDKYGKGSDGIVGGDGRDEDMGGEVIGRSLPVSMGGVCTLTRDEVQRLLHSMDDARAFVVINEAPIARMLALLRARFDPDNATRPHSLQIQSRVNGSELSHNHRTQYMFVLQTLTLWLEIARNMYRLWQAAEGDMLSEDSYYRFTDTGQVQYTMHCTLYTVLTTQARGSTGCSRAHRSHRRCMPSSEGCKRGADRG